MKVNFKKTIWLISFLLGMILTCCNTYIKPEQSKNTSEKPNDTLFLAEAYRYTKIGQELAKTASNNASDQSLRIYAEKVALFQHQSEQKWDSLSRRKNISLAGNYNKVHEKELQNLSRIKSGNFDKEFLKQMEAYLINNIELLENVSTRSEDNEITTLAITLLPILQDQMKNLKTVRDKVAVK